MVNILISRQNILMDKAYLCKSKNCINSWMNRLYFLIGKTNCFHKTICLMFDVKGGRHSSVVSCVPTIKRPQVRIPCTLSVLLQFVLLKLKWEKNKNKQKEAGIGPFLKNLSVKQTSLDVSTSTVKALIIF